MSGLIGNTRSVSSWRRLMRKLMHMLLCLSAYMAADAHAALGLSIEEYTKDPLTGTIIVIKKVDPAAPGDFVLSSTTPILEILKCTHPCSRFFPSGSAQRADGDTYVFSDTCGGATHPCVSTPNSSTAARVVKTDLPGPSVAFKGL